MLHTGVGLVSRVLHSLPNLASPNSYSTPGAIVLSITYGIDSKSADDPFLKANVEASYAVSATLVPGNFLVDTIPICTCLCTQPEIYKHLTYPVIVRYIPDWFPGMGFKVLAKEVREKFRISVGGPFEYVKNAMKIRPQIIPTPDCVFNTSLITSLAKEFLSPSHPIVCLAWRVVRKRLLMNKLYGMFQVPCLLVGLFRKFIYPYSSFSLFAVAGAATVCLGNGSRPPATSLTLHRA